MFHPKQSNRRIQHTCKITNVNFKTLVLKLQKKWNIQPKMVFKLTILVFVLLICYKYIRVSSYSGGNS